MKNLIKAAMLAPLLLLAACETMQPALDPNTQVPPPRNPAPVQ